MNRLIASVAALISGVALTLSASSQDAPPRAEQATRLRDVYLAEIDPQTGRVVKAPAPLEGAAPGITRKEPVWSPDGSRLAYVKAAEGAPEMLVLLTLATGATVGFELAVTNPDHLLWHPNGRSMTVDGVSDGSPKTVRLDLESGKFETHTNWLIWGISPDGQYSYEGRRRDGPGIARRRVSDGSVEMLTTVGSWGPRLSPDGRWLAYFTTARPRGSVALIPSSGGTPRILLEDVNFGYVRLAWTPDSQHLIIQRPPEGLHRLSINGGPPQPLGIPTGEGVGNLTEISLNPDGRRLALDISTNLSADARPPTRQD